MPEVQIRFEGYLFRETAGCLLGTPLLLPFDRISSMLKTDTAEKALELLDEGYTFPSITEETGITLEDVEAVHVAWFRGTTEQLFRELELAGVLEVAVVKLRSGEGWDKETTGDVLREILHVYPER